MANIQDPYLIGDFDPEPHDPDPDVWPLESTDPGAPAPVEDLVKIENSYPEFHVAWITPQYHEELYETKPGKPGLSQDEREYVQKRRRERTNALAEKKREEGVPPTEAREQAHEEVRGSPTPRLTLTEDRIEALDRITQLWNGEVVEGTHLLRDKCPKWIEFLGDLDQSELKGFVIDEDMGKRDYEIYERFKNHDWFEDRPRVYLQPQHVARRKVWYSPTQRGRTLINKNRNFDGLRGDQFERLRHRFAVGMTAVWLAVESGNPESISTYQPVSIRDSEKPVNPDVILLPRDEFNTDWPDCGVVAEILTDHNDRENWVTTLKKLYLFDEQAAVAPVVVAGSRNTIYKIFDYWTNHTKAELPGKGFKSGWEIEKARRKTREAYEDPDLLWPISDFHTAPALWRELVADADRNRQKLIISLDW